MRAFNAPTNSLSSDDGEAGAMQWRARWRRRRRSGVVAMGGAVERGLDLLDGGGDQPVDGGDRLGVELRRRQAADEDLERDGDDGPAASAPAAPAARGGGGGGAGGGSVVTVAFQILVSSLPSSKLNAESVATVNGLITTTVEQIKAALNCSAHGHHP